VLVVDLNQVTLPVKNMELAVQFYLKLGMTQIVDTPHYARFETPTGNSTFSLSLAEEDFYNGTTIYFEHENLEELTAHLKSKGITIDQEPTEMRYLWKEAILRDPSGNTIKLYWAGDNRTNPPWRVEIREPQQ